MKQQIRHNIFETNSSSTHALAIYNKVWEDNSKNLFLNIPIMEEPLGLYKDEQNILSFIYTIALMKHNWRLVDKIKETFSNCIFEKPQWELPNGEIDYCEDKEIISFCDLIKPNFYSKFEEEDFIYIYDHLNEIIFNCELFIKWDGWYAWDIVTLKYLNLDKDDKEWSQKAHKWIDENIKYLIERS